MGSIGCALAFGQVNDLGVTGVGFTVADLLDELHSSMLAHPGYANLFDRIPVVSDSDQVIDSYLSWHDSLEAIYGRDVDPAIAGSIIDVADRARIGAEMNGVDDVGRRARRSQRRCVVLVVVSMGTTGDALVCGAGPRLGEAFAGAVRSLQSHPLLPAFAEQRPANLAELERLATWSDPVFADLVLETELD